MQNNWKGTTGEVKLVRHENIFRLETFGTDNWIIAETITNYEQDEANAQLIADAFKVRQKIDCDLPELLEQNKQMWEMLQRVKSSYTLAIFHEKEIESLIKKSTKQLTNPENQDKK